MEFLKNHYEKVILSLVLLLMAAGAVMLVVEAGSVEEQLKTFRDTVVVADGQRPPPPDPAGYRGALSNAQPRLIDLTRGHKVFNPELWYVDTNGNLIIGTNVGVSKLFVTEIKPLRLKLELVISGSTDRPTYLARMTREFMPKLTDQRPLNRTISLNATNYLDDTRPVRKFNGYFVARATNGPPDNPVFDMEYHDPGREVEKFKLTKANPFETIVDYGAKLLYSVENIQFPSPLRKDVLYERKDAQLVFAGDTNIIVEITATNVVVKAVSNDKPTTIPLTPALAAPPARKTP
jgi:hypothetical protein